MNEPQIHVAGNLAYTPTMRYTPNGVPVTDLRVASTQRKRVGEEWEDGETLWFGVTCWKQLAENVVASLKKGDRVTVAGRLAQRTWKKEDGTDIVNLEIDASAVGVDLSRYPVKIDKPARSTADQETWGNKYVHVPTGEVTDEPLGDPAEYVPFSGDEEVAA
ncbi:MAG: single-strand binding protein [Frankiales bacterium]|nr:single-strand binding protein [Frankiales bacterium]